MNTKLGTVFSLLAVAAAPAAALEFELRADSDVIGSVQIIEGAHEDTFPRLARRYDVGYEELRRANPDVDAWLPGEGTPIVIPTQFVLPDAPRRGIVINVPELRLYYFPDGDEGRVFTYPISIGKEQWGTPYGRTSVIGKTVKPTWYPPQSIRDEHAARGDFLPTAVPPGPDNPLGDYALRLGIGGGSYLIHGTNSPGGLGMRVTHGCIRMFPEDVEALFAMVDNGTPVTIVNQPYKLGWADGGLYLEAHPPLTEEVVDEQWSVTDLTSMFVRVTQERRVNLRWDDADRIIATASGLPEFVSVPGTMSWIVETPELADAGEATGAVTTTGEL
ncbi:MAG: L,D-transpeptidase family protein [Gammaproteobacteria bacterium]|nr:L,D-transpeptidase family protein [Gammaproteobacteria bacterium]